MGKQPQIVEIKMAAVEAMVERAKGLQAKEDHDLLKGLVDTLLTLVGLVRKGRTTIARLRRLVGMVSTEKTTEVLGKLSEGEASAADGTADPAEHNEEKPAAENNAAAGKQSSTTETAASPKPDTGAQAATKPKGHGRLPASDYPDATHITVAHESLSPGDICPACGRGKLYALKEPARFLRIVGQAPLVGGVLGLPEAALQRLWPAPHGARTRRGAGAGCGLRRGSLLSGASGNATPRGIDLGQHCIEFG